MIQKWKLDYEPKKVNQESQGCIHQLAGTDGPIMSSNCKLITSKYEISTLLDKELFKLEKDMFWN